MLTYEAMYRAVFGYAVDKGDAKLYQLCDDMDDAHKAYCRYPSAEAKEALVTIGLELKAAYHRNRSIKMHTNWKNIETWETVRFSMVHSGVKAVFENTRGLPQMMLFNSVSEARDWLKADGGWKVEA